MFANINGSQFWSNQLDLCRLISSAAAKINFSLNLEKERKEKKLSIELLVEMRRYFRKIARKTSEISEESGLISESIATLSRAFVPKSQDEASLPITSAATAVLSFPAFLRCVLKFEFTKDQSR